MREIDALALVGHRNPLLQLPVQVLQMIDSFIRRWRAQWHHIRRSRLRRFFLPSPIPETSRIVVSDEVLEVPHGGAVIAYYYAYFTGAGFTRVWPYYSPGF